jgi:hypothetical protein
MSAPTTVHDPGLRAVSRVRGVRERDSLLALQRALGALREREGHLAGLHAQLARAATLEADLLDTAAGHGDAAVPPLGGPGVLLSLRMTLGQLAESTRQAREEVSAARLLVDTARERWELDKSRLTAVEQLLERRAAERRREARRADDRRTDETAAQGWLRRTTREHS